MSPICNRLFNSLRTFGFIILLEIPSSTTSQSNLEMRDKSKMSSIQGLTTGDGLVNYRCSVIDSDFFGFRCNV